METYKIVRFFRDGKIPNRTVKKGLTLDQAQKHCNDPNSSSTTCTRPACKRRTKRHGPWFDGYTKE